MNAFQTKLANELLAETQAHYNSSNRSQDKALACCYSGPQDRRCAIGRIMTEDGLEKVIRARMNANNLAAVMNAFGPDIVQEEWRPLFATKEGIEFAIQVQKLHDTNENWDENGLTERGQMHSAAIKERFSLAEAQPAIA